MPEVVICKGLPGSGKSTFARDVVRNDSNWIRINKDDLRSMIFDGHWTGKNERHIVRARNALLLAFMRKGLNIIVDDTNLDPHHEATIRDLVRDHNYVAKVDDDLKHYGVSVRVFDADVETCVKRDLARHASVGRDVIEDMYYKWIFKPTVVVHIDEAPNAVIFDMDGTLALMGERSPYDYHRVLEDDPNEAVVAALKMYVSGGVHHIIICSGREDWCQPQTEEWLARHNIPWDHMFMRKSGDKRADYIVKSEIFDEHIRGQYNIEAVYDDRNQVVRFWRSIGLSCFQVNYGNF